MEHNAQTCPNKILIDKMELDLKEVREMYHELDKNTSNHQTEINTQYKTLISLITQQGQNYDSLSRTVAEIERKFILNDYKTNKTTGIIERLSWGVVTKVGTLIIIIGSMLLALWKNLN